MKNIAFSVLKYFIVFIVTIGILVGLYVASTFIPQKSIQSNSEKSADYFLNSMYVEKIDKGNYSTYIHNYADTITLNIAYNLDSCKPLNSVLSSNYFYIGAENVNDSYYKTVFKGKSAKTSYARYWHGSSMISRVLLVFTDINGFHIINGIVLLALVVILEILLLKRKQRLLAICIFLSLLICNVYFVPLCIEYITMFIVALISAIVGVLMSHKKESYIFMLLFVTAIFAAFFDFLTIETLTLTLPLVIIFILRTNYGLINNKKQGILFCAKSSAIWMVGFVCSWSSKWLLATLLTNHNVFEDAMKSAGIRTIGAAVDPIEQCINSLFRNIVCVFPFNHCRNVLEVFIAFFAIVFIVFSVLWVYGKKPQNGWQQKVLLLIALIPYIRYLVLGNHSSIHFFFSFRAQLVVVVILLFVIGKCINKSALKPHKK